MKYALKKIFGNYIETSGALRFVSVIFFGGLSALSMVIEPVIFSQIISKIEAFYTTGIFDSQATLLLILFWGGFIVFSVIIQYIYRYVFVYKNNMRNYVNLCKKFNRKILSMGYDEYLGKQHGSLYKIYDRGTQGQESFLYFFFGEIVRSSFSIICIVAIILYIDIRMALLALSMIPVMFLLAYFFTQKLSKKQRILNDKWDSMYGEIGNSLSSFMLTKSLLLEKFFIKDMDNLLDKVHKEQNIIGMGWSLANVYTGLLVMISRLLVLGFGIYFVIDGSLAFAKLFLVFSFIGFIYFPLSFIIDRFNEIVKHLTSVEKMYNEFESIEKEDINSGKNITNFQGNIQFQNVSFGYTEDKKILKNINLDIKKGQKIALVGNTGAGKSTIVNLLLRFWDISEGKILLDGENINSLKKSSLRNHIGVVSQDNSLFNLSIEENLKFANPKATKKDIETALKNAQAEFVFDLKDGIKTVIGERGLKLSGGEKQRISIARLFLKNPEILILDEATSALDNATEKKIDAALKKLMQGKTSIIIAHRLSTIRHADSILMLENGRIVESGDYQKLIAKKGKFYNLANPDKLILG